jgi:thioredoxin reductase
MTLSSDMSVLDRSRRTESNQHPRSFLVESTYLQHQTNDLDVDCQFLFIGYRPNTSACVIAVSIKLTLILPLKESEHTL